jgi:8-oxo-dGTP pyrophosphatase MutT (NUDIX family)
MARTEYFYDPSASAANSLAPAFAAVRDNPGRLLLVRRIDSGNWELPGGRVELGESAARAAEREVAEEAGVTVTVTHLVGVYADPGHIMAYPDTGEVPQQFAVCFHATPIDGQPRPDWNEIRAAAWIDPDQIGELAVHPSMRERIADAVSGPFDHSPWAARPARTHQLTFPTRTVADPIAEVPAFVTMRHRDIADRLDRIRRYGRRGTTPADVADAARTFRPQPGLRQRRPRRRMAPPPRDHQNGDPLADGTQGHPARPRSVHGTRAAPRRTTDQSSWMSPSRTSRTAPKVGRRQG